MTCDCPTIVESTNKILSEYHANLWSNQDVYVEVGKEVHNA